MPIQGKKSPLALSTFNSEHLVTTESAVAEDQPDIIETLMANTNENGLNILEHAFFILFEHEDESFCLHLLQNLPNIEKYMYKQDEKGWFPVFRVLHIFQG